jgi:putative nucleotidyltransferase with HDIG domain
LSLVLLAAAVLSGALAVGERDGLSLSGEFFVTALAAVLLGPRTAVAVAVLAELAAAARMRTRPRAIVLNNLPASVLPALAAAFVSRAIGGSRGSVEFYVAIAVAGSCGICLGFVLFASLRRLVFAHFRQFGVRDFLDYLPTAAVNVALVVAGAAIFVKVGTSGIAFALAAILTFSYMAHLLDRSRARTQQYVSLSWGVLAGLLRALDERDHRAARHAAAVAAFSRDIAAAVGFDERDQELAHTAGLLHDIGHLALSDRVAERQGTLNPEDWEAIRRTPQLGAEMLRDLGVYGPVAEIVLSHHERLDGFGYPRGLEAEEIPELAKIIAVAETYDTLTASDTYRTAVSSFEAVRELRRVSATQLEGRYVEALAQLMQGEGLDYRRADEADFDRELDMERRLREAAALR